MSARLRGLVRTAQAARPAVAGGAALAFAAILAEALIVVFGDTTNVHVSVALAFAAGTVAGRYSKRGRFAWLRPSLVALLALVTMFVLPRAQALVSSGALAWTDGMRVAVAASGSLAAGVGLGLVLGMPMAHAIRARVGMLLVAAVVIIALELGVVRSVGRDGALLVIAFLALLPVVAGRHGPSDEPKALAVGDLAALRARRLERIFEVAIGLSLGVLAESLRQIVRDVLGAASENRALAFSVAAIALAGAGLVGGRLRLARHRVLLVAALAAAAATFFTPTIIASLGSAWGDADTSGGRGAVKVALLVLLIAPPIVAIATPAFTPSRTPHVLSHLVAGAIVGAVLTRALLISNIPLAMAICIPPVAVGLIGLLSLPRAGRFEKLDAAALLALSAVLVPTAVRFPEGPLAAGAHDVLARRFGTAVYGIERVRRGGDEVAILHDSRGVERARGAGHDGVVATAGRTSPAEVVTGVIPALYARGRERALVYGGPGGIAAGTMSRLFDEVVLVEPNEAAFGVLERFAPHNFGVTRRPNVVRGKQDAFVTLASSHRRYDAIVGAAPSLRDVGASKLITREFLTLARERLAPGGVVAISFDETLPIAGLAVVLRTLSDAFEECHFVYLGPSRYQLVCSDELVGKQASSLPDDVLAALAPVTAELGAARLLEALVLVPERFTGNWFPVPGTFDLPVLDHVMARDDNGSLALDVDIAVRFDLGAATLGGGGFEGPGVFERCFALGLIGNGRPLPRCSTLLRAAIGRTVAARGAPRDGMPLPARFLAMSADAHVRNAPTILSGATLLLELLYAGQDERARQVVAARSEKRILTTSELRFAREKNLL